jgi:isochorismate pyruvate lyase
MFKSLAQVRAAIDAMDRKIVPLLCERLYLVTQAAQFKPSVEGVVVQSRVEEVVANARRIAEKSGGRADTIEAVYRVLIDAFTVDEQNRWRELHGRS